MRRITTLARWTFTLLLGLTTILFGSRGSAPVGTWQEKAPMATPRSQHAVGVVNGIIFAIGGSDGSPCCDSALYATAVAYDPVADTWASVADMNLTRKNHGAGVVNDIVYAVGGDNDFFLRGSIDSYDAGAGAWTLKAPLPSPGGGIAVGVVAAVTTAHAGGCAIQMLTAAGELAALNSLATASGMTTRP